MSHPHCTSPMTNIREDFRSLNKHFKRYTALDLIAIHRSDKYFLIRSLLLTLYNLIAPIRIFFAFACAGNVRCEFYFGDHIAYFAAPKEAYRLMVGFAFLFPLINTFNVLRLIAQRKPSLRRASSLFRVFIDRDVNSQEKRFLLSISPALSSVCKKVYFVKYIWVSIGVVLETQALIRAYYDDVQITLYDVVMAVNFVSATALFSGTLTSFSVILFLSNELIMYDMKSLKQSLNKCAEVRVDPQRVINDFYRLRHNIVTADILLNGYFGSIIIVFAPMLCLLYSELFIDTSHVLIMWLCRTVMTLETVIIVAVMSYASRISSQYQTFFKMFIGVKHLVLKKGRAYKCREQLISVSKIIKSFKKQKMIGISVYSLILITKFTFFKLMLMMIRFAMKTYVLRET